MPILRNPFNRRAEVLSSIPDGAVSPNERASFERVDTIGSRTSSVLSLNSGRSQEAPEYEMSVVDDNGVYVQPNAPESKRYWPRRYPSNASSSTRVSEPGEIDPFPLTRESFDSYRRSFDVSARSPISPYGPVRGSLDSSRLGRYPRAERPIDVQPPHPEETFEDVGLQDEVIRPAKKRGFFAKFGDDRDAHAPSPGTSIFHMGRKRGHSGAGQELGNLPRHATNEAPDDAQ